LWLQRATNLNARPVYGRPNRLPIGMNNSTYLRECLRVDYVSFWKDLKSLVIRKRRTDAQPTKRVSFGREPSFQLNSQSYRVKIVLRKLLMDAFTGLPPHRTRIKLYQKSITDNTIVIHVPSHKQIKDLFCIGNLNSAEFQSSTSMLFSLCGTVQIKYNDTTTEEPAYIIKQHRKKLHLQTASNKVGTVTIPTFNTETSRYVFPTDGIINNNRQFTIKEYNPIRIQLSIKSCEIRIATSRLVYSKLDNDNIDIKTRHCS